MDNIIINQEELQKFMQHPDDKPVVMINLLKFKNEKEDGVKGAELYRCYKQKAAELLKQVGGKLLWLGKADQYIIGDENDKWDEVLLVEYPSRAAFLKMISLPEFKEVQKDRKASLKSTVLIASTTIDSVL
ncbi:MAG: DUF1330 domain-containing protein [Bacteroidetes bacterium]|nr:DUF1330 domain-containing protein [Bacteroidota bacterium]